MEPERNIEKELKAYARQRRAAAGTPPELHAANRKQLQEEVVRQANAGARKTPSWWQALFSSWPRLAIAGAAVVVLTLITWSSLPFSKGKRGNGHPPMELARNKTEMVNTPASAADEPMTLAPSPAPRHVRTLGGSKDAEKSTATSSAEVNGSFPSAAAVPPPSSAPAMRGALKAQAPAAPSAKRDFSNLSLSDTGVISPQSHAANRGELSLSTRSQDRIAAPGAPVVTPVIQPFRRTNLPQKKKSVKSTITQSNLLSAFRVEQLPETLRIIDSDGSVYSGFLTQTPETAAQSATILHNNANATEGFKSVTVTNSLGLPKHFYRFRVSGTNRTLDEAIVFTGNFFTDAGLKPFSPAAISNTTFGGGLGTTTAEPLQLELQKASLQGQVLLGTTNQIEIHAEPVKP